MNRSDPLRVNDYLGHILEAIDNINEYTAGMDGAMYLADKKTRDAVIRNFEVIGEACNNIARHHAQFAKSHPEVPWNFAYEMRNALAHGYFKIDQNVVWQTIQSDLPGPKSCFREIQRSRKPVRSYPTWSPKFRTSSWAYFQAGLSEMSHYL